MTAQDDPRSACGTLAANRPPLDYYSAVGLSLPRASAAAVETVLLAGSDDTCDLRLGGADMPLVHSVLRVVPYGLSIESLCPASPVLVNGEAVTSARLAQGDEVMLDTYRFTVMLPGAVPVPADELLRLQGLTTDTADTADDLVSAAELVDWLAAELDEVDAFEERRQTAADHLLAAARAAAEPRETLPIETEAELLRQVNELAALIEESNAETAKDLDAIAANLNAADRNASDLGQIAANLEHIRSEPKSYRASA